MRSLLCRGGGVSVGEAPGKVPQGLAEEIRRIAQVVLGALGELVRGKLGIEGFTARLAELRAAALLEEYGGALVASPDTLPLWEVLWIVKTLEEDARFQVQEYGVGSFREDFQELVERLRALGSGDDEREAPCFTT